MLLGLSTLTHQPSYDTDFRGYAEYVTTDQFLVSHLIASVLGAALGVLGAVALVVLLAESRAARIAFAGLVAFVIGQVLTTSVFGVAAFFQPAVGEAFLEGQEASARSINEDVYGPALFATVGISLLLCLFGVVQLGRAIRRAGVTPAWVGLAFAIAGPVFAIAGFSLELLQPVAGFVLGGTAAVAASRLSAGAPGSASAVCRGASASPRLIQRRQPLRVGSSARTGMPALLGRLPLGEGQAPHGPMVLYDQKLGADHENIDDKPEPSPGARDRRSVSACSPPAGAGRDEAADHATERGELKDHAEFGNRSDCGRQHERRSRGRPRPVAARGASCGTEVASSVHGAHPRAPDGRRSNGRPHRQRRTAHDRSDTGRNLCCRTPRHSKWRSRAIGVSCLAAPSAAAGHPGDRITAEPCPKATPSRGRQNQAPSSDLAASRNEEVEVAPVTDTPAVRCRGGG